MKFRNIPLVDRMGGDAPLEISLSIRALRGVPSRDIELILNSIGGTWGEYDKRLGTGCVIKTPSLI